MILISLGEIKCTIKAVDWENYEEQRLQTMKSCPGAQHLAYMEKVSFSSSPTLGASSAQPLRLYKLG